MDSQPSAELRASRLGGQLVSRGLYYELDDNSFPVVGFVPWHDEITIRPLIKLRADGVYLITPGSDPKLLSPMPSYSGIEEPYGAEIRRFFSQSDYDGASLVTKEILLSDWLEALDNEQESIVIDIRRPLPFDDDNMTVTIMPNTPGLSG